VPSGSSFSNWCSVYPGKERASVGLLRNIAAGRGQKCEHESKVVNSNGKQAEGQGDACGLSGGVPQRGQGTGYR